ncbi:MAG: RHS repeat protein [Oligoflexia bacterium]|nr:RHS repeat protein [Oligoflexia bacterium]
MKQYFIFFFLSCILISINVTFIGLKCLADVNPQNGNYFTSFVDIIVPANNNPLTIVRMYNSQVPKIGWFGLGWGNYFETKLVVALDGSIIVYENGTGAETIFTPKGASLAVDEASKKILEGIKKKTDITPHVEAKLLLKFKADARLRQFYAEELKLSANVANGAIFTSTAGGGFFQTIVKTEKGFERTFHNGRIEIFSTTGELIKIKDVSEYIINLVYESKTLKKIKDSDGKELLFDWHPDGRVKNIWTTNDPKKAIYVYENNKLVEATVVTGEKYKYTYDGSHMLSSITYPDTTKIEVAYTHPLRMVKEIKDRDKVVTTYTYDNDKQSPDLHYWTTITSKSPEGIVHSKKLEYERKRNSYGQDYNYRSASIDDGYKYETVYDEKSRPIQITQGVIVTNFTYTDKGLLKEKRSSNGAYSKFEYHPTLNKIIKVENNYGTSKYEYTKNGQLSTATTFFGMNFHLRYDHKGFMSTLIQEDVKNKEKRILNFKYNIMGKPVEMEMEKVGKIILEYNNFGIVKTVDPKSNKDALNEINKAFASFVDSVSSIGYNLNI